MPEEMESPMDGTFCVTGGGKEGGERGQTRPACRLGSRRQHAASPHQPQGNACTNRTLTQSYLSPACARGSAWGRGRTATPSVWPQLLGTHSGAARVGGLREALHRARAQDNSRMEGAAGRQRGHSGRRAGGGEADEASEHVTPAGPGGDTGVATFATPAASPLSWGVFIHL